MVRTTVVGTQEELGGLTSHSLGFLRFPPYAVHSTLIVGYIPPISLEDLKNTCFVSLENAKKKKRNSDNKNAVVEG